MRGWRRDLRQGSTVAPGQAIPWIEDGLGRRLRYLVLGLAPLSGLWGVFTEPEPEPELGTSLPFSVMVRRTLSATS